jgi:phosphate transport system permease protein
VTSTTYENAAAPESDLRRRGIRIGDLLFKGIAILAALVATVLLGWIAFKVFDLAWPAIQHFGLSFIWTEAWDPVTQDFGALIFIYGTVVTSLVALLLATPLSIAIALFLTEIAPRRLAAPIATIVELLAAIPSVVLGLWGILVFGPWVNAHLEPWIQSTPLGLLPMFSGTPSAAGSIFTASLVLTIMIIPITSAICRELFVRVPRDLTDGALALGSTRWEAIRGVMFAYAAPGIAAAVLLGLGRAFGEAIAVNQTIGNHNAIPSSWFEPGDSLGSKIASEYVGATSLEQASSILYLAAILMVISLATNVVAQFIVVRFERARRAV